MASLIPDLALKKLTTQNASRHRQTQKAPTKACSTPGKSPRKYWLHPHPCQQRSSEGPKFHLLCQGVTQTPHQGGVREAEWGVGTHPRGALSTPPSVSVEAMWRATVYHHPPPTQGGVNVGSQNSHPCPAGRRTPPLGCQRRPSGEPDLYSPPGSPFYPWSKVRGNQLKQKV